MKEGIKISQIIPSLIGSHMHEANFPLKISRNSTLQKVHDKQEKLDEIYTLSKKWTLGYLRVKV